MLNFYQHSALSHADKSKQNKQPVSHFASPGRESGFYLAYVVAPNTKSARGDVQGTEKSYGAGISTSVVASRHGSVKV